MSEALIVQGDGRVPTAEEDVAGVRTVLRIQLSAEQRERIGISDGRDLALCVNRACVALSEAEDQRDKLIAAFNRLSAAVGPVSGWITDSPEDMVAERIKELRAEIARLTRANASPLCPERLATLRDRILDIMQRRGWSLQWTDRSAYLHLEAAELAEAVRGKRGDPVDEAGDVLITLLALAPVGLPEIVAAAEAKLAALQTRPVYAGEERAQ